MSSRWSVLLVRRPSVMASSAQDCQTPSRKHAAALPALLPLRRLGNPQTTFCTPLTQEDAGLTQRSRPTLGPLKRRRPRSGSSGRPNEELAEEVVNAARSLPNTDKSVASCHWPHRSCFRLNVRRSDTGDVEVLSTIANVVSLSEGGTLFPKESLLNFCYLIYDPVVRHIKVWYFGFRPVW